MRELTICASLPISLSYQFLPQHSDFDHRQSFVTALIDLSSLQCHCDKIFHAMANTLERSESPLLLGIHH